ncbi:MAG TPA: FecR domain-containing protein, partial [Pyrinomonadaceae bacterium]|nr:FecR domain-containing protein [Pyrinomonadaceae bacterium]
MKRNNQELDQILDTVAAGIRDEEIDRGTVSAASSRVWARVAQETGATVINSAAATNVTASVPDHIRDCADFQTIIPAYLAGELSPARAMLLEDHTQECIPCRKALKAARTGERVAATRAVRPARSAQWQPSPVWRWAMAASVAVVAVLGGAVMFKKFLPGTQALAATLENVDGAVYSVTEAGQELLSPGALIKAGARIRTAKDSAAMLRLADGSLLETRERSEFSVSNSGGDTMVKLERGNVLVEASKRASGHLYVETPDSLVSVTGTIFAVGSGTKGSRVSVVEGEVHVDHRGEKKVLLPGDQATNGAGIERIPVQQDIAWSRNAAKYVNMVNELTKLRQDLNQRVARPGVRYSSRFLDLVPENTVVYAALPNLAESLAESHKIMQERIKQNPALAEWVGGGLNKESRHAGLNDSVIERVREFGAQLGDEIVVAGGMDAKGEPSSIVVFGELKDAANFRPFVEKQIAELAGPGDNSKAPIRFIDDPLTAAVTTETTNAQPAANAKGAKQAGAQKQREELYVWVQNGLFAASPKIETLRAVAATKNNPASNRFVGSPFHTRISEVYKEGAGLIVAADLEKIIAQFVAKEANDPAAAQKLEGFRQLGLLSMKHFVVEQKEVKSKTQSRAVLSFSEPRRGVTSWLAAPGPMGALEFISPNANVATAFVVKEPVLLVDDLLGFLETVEPNLRQQLQSIEAQQGFNLREDFAKPLGGEFAFAVDGPVLPTPSWKMILEVYDQQRLQNTLERVVDKLNGWAAQNGKGGLQWQNTTDGGRTFYSLKSVDFGLEAHYMYENGYLVAGPSRALLINTLKLRDAQMTLLTSQRFRS